MLATAKQISETEQFQQKLQNSLKATSIHKTIKLAKNNNAYIIGDKDDLIYFIETGHIKLIIISPEGKACISAIYGGGNTFGESSTNGRAETAIAMTNTQLKAITYSRFLVHLAKESLLEGFVQYLAVKISQQQQTISNLVTINSQQRLGQTLIKLAKSIGKKSIYGTTLECKVSHEELSEIVGTTRPRISLFMQRFHQFGLILTTKEHHLIIKEEKLSYYLTQTV